MLHQMILQKDVPKLAVLASNAKIGTAYSRAIWLDGQKWNWENLESHIALLFYWLSLDQVHNLLTLLKIALTSANQ